MARKTTVTVMRDALGSPTSLEQPAYLLKVLSGPDRRKQLTAHAPRLQIGGDHADFVLSDPGVSALHCEVLADASGFRVRDLGSKNGTWLRDRRVAEAWLSPTDELQIGRSSLRFKLLSETQTRPLSPKTSFGPLLGDSLRMRELYTQLERVAAQDVTVLLQGETGSGKDLAAEAIIQAGLRRDGPVVVVDCARLPVSLAESELFGHEEGAFTGATRKVLGAFERAHGGTLFLDEVGELPLELQPKLLRALEQRRVRRVGGEEEHPVDVRVIAATHLELGREVNRGRFRADLYYRLAVVNLHMPALHEHPEDIPLLVSHFLAEQGGAGKLAPDALQALYESEYPGNVRELRNAVERAVAGVSISQPAAVRRSDVDLTLSYRQNKERTLHTFERQYVSALLKAAGGNLSEAARQGQMDRMFLHKLVRRLGLQPGLMRD